MPANPPENTPRISPYLYYQDVAAALEWLGRSFGFSERMAVKHGNGMIMHAELELGGNIVMLGTPLDPDGKPNAAANGPRHAGLMCYVDDVNAHFETAKAAGATIVTPPADQDYGSRTYTASDTEGQLWLLGSEG